MIDLFSALAQLPNAQRNGFLYETFFKCAVSHDTEAGIAHCGGFLICLRHTYCVILFFSTEGSDICTHCQSVVLASCWAYSFLQGLMFSLCRKQSIVTRAGGGRPVETNDLAFDK